jgi:hypothetical protein
MAPSMLDPRPTITRVTGRDMDYVEIQKRTAACIGGLPKREVRLTTRTDYRKTFARMLREPTLDPLSPGIAFDTYQHRRAAMHWGSRVVLERVHKVLEAAISRDDIRAARLAAAILVRLLSRIEPALQLDPPLQEGASALQSGPSRWKAAAGPHPERGAHSKRHVLGLLPPQWDESVWQKALEIWTDPSDQQDRNALAVRLLVPVRSEDFVPGERAHGWSEGVAVKLRSPHRLDITISPAKSHNGKYGTGITVAKIDPTKAGDAASYLAARCGDGAIVISLVAKEASRKKLMRLGQIALPGCDVTITPNVFRNQAIADWKATVGAGIAVAAVCGHCTERTQAKYGYVQHGRRRHGLLGVSSKVTPESGNIARTFELSKRHSEEPPNEVEIGTRPTSNDTGTNMNLVGQGCPSKAKDPQAKIQSLSQGKRIAVDRGLQQSGSRQSASDICDRPIVLAESPGVYPLFEMSSGP